MIRCNECGFINGFFSFIFAVAVSHPTLFFIGLVPPDISRVSFVKGLYLGGFWFPSVSIFFLLGSLFRICDSGLLYQISTVFGALLFYFDCM